MAKLKVYEGNNVVGSFDWDPIRAIEVTDSGALQILHVNEYVNIFAANFWSEAHTEDE